MSIRTLFCIALLPCALAAQTPPGVPDVLPAFAATQLATSLEASAGHSRHVWRDTPPLNADGTVNAYIEIARLCQGEGAGRV